MIYQFAFHDRVQSTPPECRMKELHDKCEAEFVNDVRVNNLLTKEEKQEIFDKTREYKGVYKLAGWSFDFKKYMKRYIVNHYDNWSVIYAFSKENIRENIYTKTGIEEIHEIKHRM